LRVSIVAAVRVGVLSTLALVAIVAMPSAATAAAGRDRPLATVVLPSALPGYVVDKPGPLNGPLPLVLVAELSSIGDIGGNNIPIGDVSGYVRTWQLRRSTRDVVEVVALRFAHQSEIPAYLLGFHQGELNRGNQEFVTALKGSDGFAGVLKTSKPPLTTYVVSFARGDVGFAVFAQTLSGKLTFQTDTQLALLQAIRAPGPVVFALQLTTPFPIGLAIAAAVVAVLAALAMYLLQARRRWFGELAPATFDRHLGRHDVGWYASSPTPSTMYYWDGRAWTTLRALRGASWVDAPCTQPEPGHLTQVEAAS
jgi:hypothetical protein